MSQRGKNSLSLNFYWLHNTGDTLPWYIHNMYLEFGILWWKRMILPAIALSYASSRNFQYSKPCPRIPTETWSQLTFLQQYRSSLRWCAQILGGYVWSLLSKESIKGFNFHWLCSKRLTPWNVSSILTSTPVISWSIFYTCNVFNLCRAGQSTWICMQFHL